MYLYNLALFKSDAKEILINFEFFYNFIWWLSLIWVHCCNSSACIKAFKTKETFHPSYFCKDGRHHLPPNYRIQALLKSVLGPRLQLFAQNPCKYECQKTPWSSLYWTFSQLPVELSFSRFHQWELRHRWGRQCLSNIKSCQGIG